MTAIRGMVFKFAATVAVAVVVGLLAPVSTAEALGAGAQRTVRLAKPAWRFVPTYVRRYEPPFVLIMGIGF